MKKEKVQRLRKAVLEINADYRLGVKRKDGEAISKYAYRLEWALKGHLVKARLRLRQIEIFREAIQEADCNDTAQFPKSSKDQGKKVS